MTYLRLNLPSTFVTIDKSWKYATGRSIENRIQTRGMFRLYISSYYIKVKWSRYRPDVAQRVGTRRGWVVSSTPRPHFTPRKDPVPILQEAGWAPGPVWTGGKSRPHWDMIPDRPARSQSLYRLSYRAHIRRNIRKRNNTKKQYKQHTTQEIQVYRLPKHPHITKQVKTTAAQDTHQKK